MTTIQLPEDWEEQLESSGDDDTTRWCINKVRSWRVLETREEPPRITREISNKITRAFVHARVPSEMTRALIDNGVFRAPSPAPGDTQADDGEHTIEFRADGWTTVGSVSAALVAVTRPWEWAPQVGELATGTRPLAGPHTAPVTGELVGPDRTFGWRDCSVLLVGYRGVRVRTDSLRHPAPSGEDSRG